MGQTTGRIPVRSEAGIQEFIRTARATGQRLRAVGSGGSKSGINTTSGAAIELADGEGPILLHGHQVTAPAGITTETLQRFLRPHGLMLPTVGEWKYPTLAGSLATGTHGGSAHHGITSTSLHRIRLVAGTGEVLDIARGEPDFPHAGVSLGALGVITQVTLECVPRSALKLETDVVPYGDYLRDPLAHERRAEFHASIWVPSARRVIRFAADRAPSRRRAQEREQRFGWRTAFAVFASRYLHLHGAISQRVFRRTAVADAVEILSPIAVSPRVVRTRVAVNIARQVRATEFAFPAARAGEVLERLDALFRAHARSFNNPIGLRLSAGDDFTLSPCTGRTTLWVDLFYGASPAFVEALARIADDLDARCHWGKYMAIRPESLRRRFPGWAEFAAARARFDPGQLFANRFTDSFGLTHPAAGAHAG